MNMIGLLGECMRMIHEAMPNVCGMVEWKITKVVVMFGQLVGVSCEGFA